MIETIAAFLISIGINPSHLPAGLAGGFARISCGASGSRGKWLAVVSWHALYGLLEPLIGKWALLDEPYLHERCDGLGEGSSMACWNVSASERRHQSTLCLMMWIGKTGTSLT
jgi:hypothetical protein